MNVKLAAEENVEDLMSLYHQLIVFTARMQKRPCQKIRRIDREFLRSVIRESGRDFILIRDCDKIVGFALAEEKKPERGDAFLSVEDFFIVQSYRRKGFGTQLMDEVKKWGKNRGLGRMEVRVMAQNRGACRFYEKYKLRETYKILSCDL